MAEMDGSKKELGDTEVKDEKQDPLSLKPTKFPGKKVNEVSS